MMKSKISERVERVQVILDHVDELNERARLLMMLIEKEDREEKDRIRYAGILGN